MLKNLAKKILLENSSQVTVNEMCGCGNVGCDGGHNCAHRGNHLDLSLIQTERRGIDFNFCLPNFGYLLGYRHKECLSLQLPPNHRLAEHIQLEIEEEKDDGRLPPMSMAVPTLDNEMDLGRTRGRKCEDNFAHLLGYRHKDCIKRHHTQHGTQAQAQQSPPAALAATATATATSKYEGRTIQVTFADKITHPNAEYIACKEAIHIDGRAGAPIRLTVGETYTFEVGESTEGHQFMLTDHPAGGPEARKCWHKPITNGRVTVEVSADFPRRCYYQSTKNRYVGGWVIVNGYTNDKTLRESVAGSNLTTAE